MKFDSSVKQKVVGSIPLVELIFLTIITIPLAYQPHKIGSEMRRIF